jgi:asparagine synthetase B (glutamine-hydrolysing)
MALSQSAVRLGDLTIFGYVINPEFLERRLPIRLGIVPRTIDFGSSGHFFFHTTYGDVAETKEAIALKLGFVRSLTKSPFSTQQLLEQKIISPHDINHSTFRGNALVACFSKTRLKFSVFKTLLAVPQLYYYVSSAGIICSDRLRCLVNIMDQVELNQDVLPMHFLFRSIPGDLTYFCNIRRMLPGQLLRWTDGELEFSLLQDLHLDDSGLSFARPDTHALDALYESLHDVIRSYVVQIEASGQDLANLLSGGVDSSIVQSIINAESSKLPAHSISYATRTPSFEFEIEYAQQASQLFGTEHIFVDYYPEDYPGLLTRAIDNLAQPPVLETEPSMLAVAEFVEQTGIPARFFFSGQGADGLLGLEGARKLKGLNYLGKIPKAALFLKGVGLLLKPITPYSQRLLKGAEILASTNNPQADVSPLNTIAVYVNPDIVRRCFGDQALRTTLEYRRDLAAQYLNSDHYLEKVYVIDLLTDAYEVALQRYQLFLAHRQEQLHPFLDEDVIRVGFAFHPSVRYIKGFQNKYVLKKILEQKTGSTVARKPKGFSIFEHDLYAWMQTGPLRPLVQDIQLPGFLSRADYDQLMQRPSYFLWGLLTFDIFVKRILNHRFE